MAASSRPRRRSAMALGLLPGSMACGVIPSVVFGALGPQMLALFDVNRGQIGVLVAAFSLGGAVLSPVVGLAVDRLGGDRALVFLFGYTAATTLGLAMSRDFTHLLLVALAGSLANALVNPATNEVIASRIREDDRAIVMGFKHAGVQVAYLLGGFVLGPAALVLGWKEALTALALLPLAAMTASWYALFQLYPAGEKAFAANGSNGAKVSSPATVHLWTYALLMGAAMATLTSFLPLYGSEVLRLPSASAAWLIGVAGLVAVFMGPGWNLLTRRYGNVERILALIAGLGIISLLLTMMSNTLAYLIWPAAVLAGASLLSWHSVVMLASLNRAGPGSTGRSAGKAFSGFLAGLGIGPAVFGQVAAHWGYRSAWSGTLIVTLTALLSTLGRANGHGDK